MQEKQPSIPKHLRASAALRKLASSQGGVVLDRQLRALRAPSRLRSVIRPLIAAFASVLPASLAGRSVRTRRGAVPSYTQARRIASGVWQKRLGVTAILECVSNNDLRDAWALALRIGEDGIVTGPTAARLQGVPIECDLVLGISPIDHHVRVPGALILRRNPVFPMLSQGSIRMTTSMEAVLDTLEALPAHEASQLLDTALQRRWITASFIESARDKRAALGQHHGKISRLHAQAAGGAQSVAERRMRALLMKHKLRGWEGNHRIDDAAGRPIALIDLAHIDLRIAIEVDGRSFHSDRRTFEQDRARQNKLTIAGWTVLRFTWEQITENPTLVIRTVRSTIQLRKT